MTETDLVPKRRVVRVLYLSLYSPAVPLYTTKFNISVILNFSHKIYAVSHLVFICIIMYNYFRCLLLSSVPAVLRSCTVLVK